jgi:hypothetical protein
MLQKRLITIAIVWIVCLFSQRSSAQVNSFCADEPEYTRMLCGGGIGCYGSVQVPQNLNYGEGFYWAQEKQACTGGYGCYVMTYVVNYEIFCQDADLRRKETQDQLASLALDRNVIIADCRGHYRQYRRRAFVGSTWTDSEVLRDILR